MNKADAFVIVEIIRSFGQPLSNDDLTIQAWSNALNEGMTRDWAARYISRHFAKSNADLRVADLNAAWAEKATADYWEQQRIAAQQAALEEAPEDPIATIDALIADCRSRGDERQAEIAVRMREGIVRRMEASNV